MKSVNCLLGSASAAALLLFSACDGGADLGQGAQTYNIAATMTIGKLPRGASVVLLSPSNSTNEEKTLYVYNVGDNVSIRADEGSGWSVVLFESGNSLSVTGVESILGGGVGKNATLSASGSITIREAGCRATLTSGRDVVVLGHLGEDSHVSASGAFTVQSVWSGHFSAMNINAGWVYTNENKTAFFSGKNVSINVLSLNSSIEIDTPALHFASPVGVFSNISVLCDSPKYQLQKIDFSGGAERHVTLKLCSRREDGAQAYKPSIYVGPYGLQSDFVVYGGAPEFLIPNRSFAPAVYGSGGSPRVERYQ